MFYFGYLFWEYPTTILIQKLPVGKYLSTAVISWGAVVAATAACTNFDGLAATRFLLGLFEATVVPSFVYIISQWYTRDEAPVRTSFWFVGNDIGATVSGLIIYGIGRIQDPLKPWQWMFIVSQEN
jgi:MFS family permease